MKENEKQAITELDELSRHLDHMSRRAGRISYLLEGGKLQRKDITPLRDILFDIVNKEISNKDRSVAVCEEVFDVLSKRGYV